MNRTWKWCAIAFVAAAATAAGFAFNLWRSEPSAGMAGDVITTIDAVGLRGLDAQRSSLAALRGKVVVVNFWATWCAPCREEIPLFVELQKKHGARGLQFVGIAVDQRDKVVPYAAELGMNFPILIGGAEALDLARRLGNRVGVLPFTLIVGRDGKIVAREVGAAKKAKLEALLAALL